MSSKKNPTRDRILKSTQTLLETKGAADVRMADIAKRAGISRQALYLHFPNRAELLIATTRYLDEVHNISAEIEEKMMCFHGVDRLNGLIETWGNYIPKIYGVGKALMSIKETDVEANAAWQDRMSAVRALCALTVDSLDEAGALSPVLDRETAIDLLWMLVSVSNWEQLTKECGWSQADYLKHMQCSAESLIAA